MYPEVITEKKREKLVVGRRESKIIKRSYPSFERGSKFICHCWGKIDLSDEKMFFLKNNY